MKHDRVGTADQLLTLNSCPQVIAPNTPGRPCGRPGIHNPEWPVGDKVPVVNGEADFARLDPLDDILRIRHRREAVFVGGGRIIGDADTLRKPAVVAAAVRTGFGAQAVRPDHRSFDRSPGAVHHFDMRNGMFRRGEQDDQHDSAGRCNYEGASHSPVHAASLPEIWGELQTVD